VEGRRRIRKAEATFRETDAVWAKVAGPDSSESSVTEVNLGNLLAYEGRYPQAEGVLRNALRISRLHYPETSKQVRFARFRLANTLAHVGKSEEAITLVQVLLDGPAPESDYEHYILGASEMAFAEASLRLNRSDRALSAARSALEQMKALRPLDNTNIGRAQFLIGRIEIARGKRDEAKTTLREAVATLAQEEDADADPRMPPASATMPARSSPTCMIRSLAGNIPTRPSCTHDCASCRADWTEHRIRAQSPGSEAGDRTRHITPVRARC
jgi:serine/threonine-protein kinase